MVPVSLEIRAKKRIAPSSVNVFPTFILFHTQLLLKAIKKKEEFEHSLLILLIKLQKQ